MRERWPRVSVVVCAYNSADTFDDCLASLARLDYPDWELIVVNDGSRDETGAIAQRWAQSEARPAMYRPDAARDAWSRLVPFLHRHLD